MLLHVHHDKFGVVLVAQARLVAFVTRFLRGGLIERVGHLLELRCLHGIRVISDFFLHYINLVAVVGSIVVLRVLLMHLSVVVVAASLERLARRRRLSRVHCDCGRSCLHWQLLGSTFLLTNVLSLSDRCRSIIELGPR